MCKNVVAHLDFHFKMFQHKGYFDWELLFGDGWMLTIHRYRSENFNIGNANVIKENTFSVFSVLFNARKLRNTFEYILSTCTVHTTAHRTIYYSKSQQVQTYFANEYLSIDSMAPPIQLDFCTLRALSNTVINVLFSLMWNTSSEYGSVSAFAFAFGFLVEVDFDHRITDLLAKQ